MKNVVKSLILASLLGLITVAQAWAEKINVTFLLTNDIYEMHGKARGGYGRLNAVVKAERAKGGNLIYVHAGDTISPSLLSGFDQGEHIIELANIAPPDIFIPGNHEFDFGKDIFLKRMSDLKGNKLAANLRMPGGSKVPGIEDTMMMTYGDASDPLKMVKIGIIGLTAEDSAVKSNPEDLEIATSVETGLAQAKALRKAGADIIVVAVHGSRSVDRRLYATKAFDIILTGDDHDMMLFYDGRKMMIESGEDGEYVSAVDVTIDVVEKRGRRRVSWHPNFRIMDTADVTPDPDTMAKVAGYENTLSKELDVPVGSTANDLDSRKESVRGGETAMGNLIADAMRKAVGADIAITNGGGIRGNKVYAEGSQLTRRDILTELPFGNKTLLLEVDGAMVKAALENGVSKVEDSQGRFPHVSGLTFSYDKSKPAGSRVTAIMIGGKPLDESAKFKLAANDYIAGGGDGYRMLRKAKILLGDLDGKLMANDVMAYIRAAGSVEAKVEGRIIAQ